MRYVLAFVLVVGGHSQNTFLARPTLKQRIDAVYLLSVQQCGEHFPGEEECVAKQFALNYRWEITQDQPRWFGAPSVPTRGGAAMNCPTGSTGPLGPVKR